MSEKLDKLMALARSWSKYGDSSGAVVGGDIESVLESMEYDGTSEDEDEAFDLVEGELDEVVGAAKAMKKEVKKLRGE